MLSKRSTDCGLIRDSKKAIKKRQAEKLKKLKQWGNMTRKTPTQEDETNFQLIEYVYNKYICIVANFVG